MEQSYDLLQDQMRMGLALSAAREAWAQEETPVGAVIFHGDRLIGKACNQRETLQDPTAHAEVLAITQAAGELGSWRFNECTMYVTLEPCPMCAGAIMQARLGRLVYGADDPKAGACGSLMDITGCSGLNHTVEITRGVLGDECGGILREFFRIRREQKKAEKNGMPPPPLELPGDQPNFSIRFD